MSRVGSFCFARGSYGFLQERDYGIEVREVPYKLQKGSNAMLRIWTKKLAL